MDLYKTVQHSIQSKIKQEHYPLEPKPITRAELEHLMKMSMFLSFFIGFISVWLSWSRNTALGISTGWKIFYAFFAGMFGTLYLFFYFLRSLIEQDIFKHLKKSEI